MPENWITVAVFALTIVFASARTGAEEEDAEEEKRPPREAVEACQSASQGDACSFSGRRGEWVQGSCEAPPQRPLACRPSNPPPGLHREAG